MARLCRSLSAAVLFVSLIGCGGGGSSTGGGGGSTDRATALTAASQQWDSISHADPGTAATQMADWLKTQPAFTDVGVTNDLVVWAATQDGTYVGWTDDSYLNGPGRAAPMPAAPRTRVDPGLPTGKTAYLFQADVFTLDPSRVGSDIRSQLAAMLQKAGYTVVRATGALADYQAISSADNALLWTNAHGYLNPHVKVGGVEQTHYYMASSTTVSVSDDKPGSPYWDDLHTGRLIYLKTPNQPYFYWFSGAWLSNNVHFGHNSVWINNACEGFTTSEMRDAAFHNGLSAYVGWDESVLWNVANNAAMYLVDRMAGTNLAPTVPDPPQRPFDLSDVVSDMSKQSPSLTVSSVDVPWFFKYLPPPFNQAHGVTAHLQTASNEFSPQPPDYFAILNPTIQNMDIDTIADNQTTLRISGLFGPTKGKVTIDDNEISVTDWKSGTITCLLPPGDQPGASGDVVVEVDGRKSNPVQLTMWTITLHSVDSAKHSGTIVIDPAGMFNRELDGDVDGTTTESADLLLYIRADVHEYRTTAGQTNLNQSLRDFVVTRNARKTKNAKVTKWDANGTVTTQVHYVGEAPYDTWTDTLSTTGSPPVLFDGSDPRGFPSTVFGNVDVQAHKMKLYPFMNPDGLYEDTRTTTYMPSTTKQPAGGIAFNPNNSPTGPVPLNVTLGSDFSVQGGTYSETYSDTSQGVSGTRTISWSGSVSNAPKSDSARSAAVRRSSRVSSHK